MVTPRVNSAGERELLKAQEKIDQFDAEVKAKADPFLPKPVEEVETQTKMSTREINKTDGVYLKPIRTISCKEPFNEKYREDYEFMKERVRFIAENYEIIGDSVYIWTRKFPGVSAEYWEVPTNKVVIGPRYVAEQIASKSYIRLKMDQTSTSSEGGNVFYGQLVAETRIQRLGARPAEGFHKRASAF